jgi:hypothetical protein
MNHVINSEKDCMRALADQADAMICIVAEFGAFLLATGQEDRFKEIVLESRETLQVLEAANAWLKANSTYSIKKSSGWKFDERQKELGTEMQKHMELVNNAWRN